MFDSTTPADDAGAPRMPDSIVAIIRTLVPMLAIPALAWLAGATHIAVPPKLSALAIVALTGAAASAYYLVAVWLERRTGYTLGARAGRMLGRVMLGGIGRLPVYVARDERVRVLGADGSMRQPS